MTAKIKKLKENNQTIYPATIAEGVVIYPTKQNESGETVDLSAFIEKLLTVLSQGNRSDINMAFSDLQSSLGSGKSLDLYINDVNVFIEKVNTFLEDAGATQGVIDSWKELEDFLAGVTDSETLTGKLQALLSEAKSYANTTVSSATANAVTMGSNAGAADRVMVSAGANKTAKDSGVALSSLARTTTATSSANGLMSAADKAKLDGIVPSTLAKTDMSNVSLGILESKIKSAGFVPTIVLPISFTGDEGTISGNFNEIRGAFNSAAQGEAHILFVNSADNSYILIVNLIRNNEDSYYGYVLQKSYIQSVVVDMSGVNANVTFHDYLDFTETYLTGVPVATASALGGVKSGGNITVASNGTVTVNQATKATQDSAGANITSTYLKASTVTDVTDYKEITL